MSEPARRVVLLGDSILDNRSYAAPEPDTATHLRALLGAGWTIELLARDGATMSDLRLQLRAMEGRASVAILSIGGNDALEHVGLLERRGSAAGAVLDELLTIAEGFERRYEQAVRAVAARADYTLLCTIYEVQLEPAVYARRARVPLAVLNDRIVRTAARLGVDVLELRGVCTSPSDFVLQIEPSAAGAARIAGAIGRVLRRDPDAASARLHSGGPSEGDERLG